MSNKKWPYLTGGIPDAYFIRGDVPMTKAEVRTVTLSKARLADGQIVWDVGAGTGSLSVEAALAVPAGKVFAVEREADAVALIRQNAAAFGLTQITVVHGAAPEALTGLPAPDRVLIGGSGGCLPDILELAYRRMPVGGRLVVNAIVLETLTGTVSGLKALGAVDIEITQVGIAKASPVGGLHMFKSQNPVFIISAEKPAESPALRRSVP